MVTILLQRRFLAVAKRMKRFRPPLWLIRLREILAQIMLPLIIFQFLRLLFLPTTLDVVLLAIFILIYVLLIIGII